MEIGRFKLDLKVSDHFSQDDVCVMEGSRSKYEITHQEPQSSDSGR